MTDAFTVSADELVVLARVASKAKLARDAIEDRDALVAASVTEDGLEVAVVAKAAELTPAEVAAIVFAQEANPSPLAHLRRSVRARRAVATAD